VYGFAGVRIKERAMSSVSVVIPCYNYGRYLPEAVSSVLNDQPGVDVRVLVIDDASQDDSADVARQLAEADSRVEVSVHPANQGTTRTFNEGVIDWADGDYTVLLSADDQLTPGSLRRAVDLLDANPGVGFAYGHPVHFNQGSPPAAARTKVQGWSVWPGAWWLERRFRDGTNCITAPEVVVRTSVQKLAGGYDPRLAHSGDLEMWLRLAAYADVGYVRGVDQAFYRIHGKNMTVARTQVVDLRERQYAYETMLDHCSDRVKNARSLSDMVHRRLAWEALWRAARAYDRGQTKQAPIDELIAFAFECWPEAGKMPAYRGLKLRQWIGPRSMPFLQPLIVTAVVRKAQNWWWWRSWKLRGI
jgi:glycosyltransferase involved in cell wall biosynthesis